VNALVNQGNSLLTIRLHRPASSPVGGTKRSAEALLRQGVVGATGFEPVTPSVSANHREPRCYRPFSRSSPTVESEGNALSVSSKTLSFVTSRVSHLVAHSGQSIH
jgi:hypothetical protein